MNKLVRLSPTGIEYGDYAWNFASGCGNNADGKCKAGGFKCWAYPITQRFADRYPNGFKPTIYPEALLSPLYLKKPSRILCAFMGDLFWDCPDFDPHRPVSITFPDGQQIINCSLNLVVKDIIQHCPQHTFLFLTKQPQNLIKFSPFPDNCYVGVSATGFKMFAEAMLYLSAVEAKVKYISFEPLLQRIGTDVKGGYGAEFLADDFQSYLNWVIIGAQTKPYKPPQIEWIREIVEACDKAGIPVFLNDNLNPLFAENDCKFFTEYRDKLFTFKDFETDGKTRWHLRQEMPKGGVK